MTLDGIKASQGKISKNCVGSAAFEKDRCRRCGCSASPNAHSYGTCEKV